MTQEKILRRSYQRKFDSLKSVETESPPQGWLRTIRELLGMTAVQFARRIGVSQSRIVAMEKNEPNLKLSTMKRIADSLNCDFIYALVPREDIDNTLRKQAEKTAQKMLDRVNANMALENQLAESHELLVDLTDNLLNGKLSKIWNE